MARRIFDETEKAIRVTASYEKFDGDLAKWKESFYTIWRYQLTWSFAYEVNLNESRRGVFVDLLIKPAYRKNVEDMMDDLGYKEVQYDDERVGVIYRYDNDIPDDIDHIIAE